VELFNGIEKEQFDVLFILIKYLIFILKRNVSHCEKHKWKF